MNELYLGVYLMVVLNQFHATIFIIPHFSNGKVSVETSRSLGNEISDFRE